MPTHQVGEFEKHSNSFVKHPEAFSTTLIKLEVFLNHISVILFFRLIVVKY